jgi:hypothetical protein
MDTIFTERLSLKELQHLFIDKCVNGYTLKLNMVFKGGLWAVAKELASEKERREAEQQTQSAGSANAE